MQYLYRGLRQDEVDADCVLIPKGIDTFEYIETPAVSPFRTSEGPTGTTYNHQRGELTCGVSTTPDKTIAIQYAGCSVVVEIDRLKLQNYGIKEYIVGDILKPGRVKKPEDKEVIVSRNKTGPLPRDICSKVYKVVNGCLTQDCSYDNKSPNP